LPHRFVLPDGQLDFPKLLDAFADHERTAFSATASPAGLSCLQLLFVGLRLRAGVSDICSGELSG
jgi:hypothetical protein